MNSTITSKELCAQLVVKPEYCCPSDLVQIEEVRSEGLFWHLAAVHEMMNGISFAKGISPFSAT